MEMEASRGGCRRLDPLSIRRVVKFQWDIDTARKQGQIAYEAGLSG